jgi:2-polyprenyl-3-methyl-5-hydroxy-6-metoxy-1,4-benzoquinol methylase
MSAFEKYAAYYNLLYHDKDYVKEADYIDRLIRKFQPNAKTILDLGCGTGKHASLLAGKGYQVHGVDMSSEMLVEAQKFSFDNLKFSLGDVRKVRLNQTFDVVVSLFHVMSYQTSNQDLEQAFETAWEHLKPKGLFVFDCWYGPAVLTDRPVVRVKRLENEVIFVTRIAEPVMHSNDNVVDVNYQIYIKQKDTGEVTEIQETHHMRYLFKPEILWLFNIAKFEPIGSFEFMSDQELGYQTWNGCFVAQKKA